jgi:hypothetical protein
LGDLCMEAQWEGVTTRNTFIHAALQPPTPVANALRRSKSLPQDAGPAPPPDPAQSPSANASRLRRTGGGGIKMDEVVDEAAASLHGPRVLCLAEHLL